MHTMTQAQSTALSLDSSSTMVGSIGFSVKVERTEMVAAALPLQEQYLPLSNLDLLLPPLHFSVFFCYKPTPNMAAPDIIASLKASLAKVLVTYYFLAGEVAPNSAGEPELHCNNRGVSFVEAYADIGLGDLQLYDPDETVEKKLVPTVKNKGVVLCVQVTELVCGGVVLACTFHHQILDAYSANMFLVSWAEMAQSKPISMIPSSRRSLLSPRRPGRHDASVDRLYVPVSSLPPPAETAEAEKAINRIYYIAAADVERMQSSSGKRTKLEAFTAHLWQIVGKGAKKTGARACSMGVVVDGRSRLRRGNYSSFSSMDNYFGNVLSIPYGTLGVDELETMAVQEVAEEVHEFVRGAATDQEHFLGMVDWVEALRPAPAVARIYAGGGDEVGEVAVVVSSGRGFPVEKVEFGWGRAVLGSYHFPWGGSAGYVMPMPSPRRDGDWVVYAHLMPGLVEELEAADSAVFRPITAEYLMLAD